MSENKGPRKIDRIKSGVLSRGLSLARLGIGTGAQLAGRGIAQLWENKDFRDEKWKAFFSEQARRFSREMGELKGSLMKAGQMLSMYGEHFFPPEVNQFLKSLQHESPPVRWPAMRATLVKELGEAKLAELEIEEDSLASASMGQVHRARIRATGEQIVLKIQYPGVDKAVDSDLRAIRGFLNMMQVFPKDFNADPIFDELREMLQQETDYRLEADLTERYAAELQGDERYVVPRVFRDYSTGKVLALSFEAGVRVDDPLVQSLSAGRRHRLAENYLDLYFLEIFRWSLVQTDPHAGNYRVRLRPDGRDQLVLLDFGATRPYGEKFMGPYRRMIKASVLGDLKKFHRAARDLSFLQENDDPALEKLFEEFCFMIVEPFRENGFDWKNTDLPQRTSRKVLEILRGFAWRTPPREVLFLDRKTGGVFIMMSLLGAKIQGRDLILRYLSEIGD
ncbi:MAG: AarF/ABC1/UbiB kinase family protein [Bdellovibrionaceae bacterium]|nr:AarF/ABC1/UbiB kinase family protein [Pseudobdellovibrionaceae bacterium]MBX3033892.1 AarF/ABC1/UbiB kinase family protein [Pseudobdellovibrionaceae bacterium]